MGDPKICASIQVNTTDQTISEAKRLGDTVDYIELRLDYRTEPISLKEVRDATHVPLIATNRCKEQGGYASEPDRLEVLREASEAGFEFIDLEILTPSVKHHVKSIQAWGCKVILSHHDFHVTPLLGFMQETRDKAARLGADVCKIIGTAESFMDNIVYLKFLKRNPGNISFGMGQHGVVSRVLSPYMGALFTYAASSSGRECAPGQLTPGEMSALYSVLKGGL